MVLVDQEDEDSACLRGQGYRQLFPNGTIASEEFQVLAGHTLILTDISWSASDPSDSFDWVGLGLFFWLNGTTTEGRTESFYNSAPILITPQNQKGRLGGNETLKGGVTVGEGISLCGSVSAQRATPTFNASLDLRTSFLRGVLVPNPTE